MAYFSSSAEMPFSLSKERIISWQGTELNTFRILSSKANNQLLPNKRLKTGAIELMSCLLFTEVLKLSMFMICRYWGYNLCSLIVIYRKDVD